MKYLITGLLLSFALLAGACKQLLGDDFMKEYNTTSSPKASGSRLQNVISNAQYEVSNNMIYSKPGEYKSKTIAALGYMAQQKFLSDDKKTFYMVGNANGYAANFIIKLDHPLTEQKTIAQDIEIITVGTYIRVFGRYVGLEEYMVEDGTSKKLPVLEAIAIYSGNDERFQRPLWLNLMYN